MRYNPLLSLHKFSKHILLFVCIAITSPIYAATATWTGAGGNSLWSTKENWSGNIALTGGETLIFPENAAFKINTNNLTYSFNSIIFTGDTGGYKLYFISGSTGLSNGIISNALSGFTNTIHIPITLLASQTFTCSNAHSILAINGDISNGAFNVTCNGSGTINLDGNIIGNGTGGLIKSGTGTLNITGNNTYFGQTIINAGIVSAGSTLAFGSTSSGTTINDGASLNINGVSLAPESLSITGTGYSSGGALTGTNATSSTNTPSHGGSIILMGNSSLGGSGTLAISGIISGSFGLTKVGNGTVVLSGANTYTGTTIINSGILSVQSALALGSTTGETYVFNGGCLDIDGVALGNEAITINGSGVNGNGALIGTNTSSHSGTITLGSFSVIGGPGIFTQSGVISGNYGLSKIGLGTLILSTANPNTWTGGTFIKDGILRCSGGMAIPDSSSVMIVNTSATTASLDIQNPETIGSIISCNAAGVHSTSGNPEGGSITLSSGATLTCGGNGTSTQFNGTISGNGGLSKNGFGTFKILGTNSYLGGTTVSQGTLLINGDSSAATGDVTVATGATLSGSGPIGGKIINFGTLSPGDNSASTLVISKNNTTSMPVLDLNSTTISNFTLGTISDRIDCTGTHSSVILGGILNIHDGPGFDVGNYTLINCTDNSSSAPFSTINMPYGYIGSVSITSTSVILTVSLDSYVETWNGSSLSSDDWSAHDNWVDTTAPSSGGWEILIFPDSATRKSSMNCDLGGFRVINFSGILGGYTIAGSVPLTFSESIASSATSGNSNSCLSPLSLSSTVSLISHTVGGSLILGGSITLMSGSALLCDGNGNTIISGNIVNSGSSGGVQKIGLGNLTLSGTNAFSGATTISSGTIIANSSTALGDASSTNTLYFDGGTLKANGTIISPSTRPITLSKMSTIDTNNYSVTLAGVISGSGGYFKTYAGTLTLSATNTYTGQTVISAGTLEVIGSTSSSSAILLDGGTLSGTGSILGNVSAINAGGTINPGSSGTPTGTLSIANGNISVGSSTFATQLDFSGGSIIPGTVAVTGIMNISNAALSLSLGTGTPTAGQYGTIIDNMGSNSIIGTFAGKPENAVFKVGSIPFTITYVGGDGNDVVLTVLNSPSAPVITTQPQSITIQASTTAVTTSATFTVVATGTSLTYQWMHNNSAISGATSDTYTLSPISISDSNAHFTCVVSDINNTSSTSNIATLTVVVGEDEPPQIARSSSITVGNICAVRVWDGQPPYTVSVSGAEHLPIITQSYEHDIDNDDDLDAGVLINLILNQTGLVTVSVTDNLSRVVSTSFTAIADTSSLVAISLPSIPITNHDDRGIWTAIGMPTRNHVNAILDITSMHDDTEIRAITYDALNHGWVELPDQPQGNVRPITGLYIATRMPISMEFNVHVPQDFWTVPLQPGWNLASVPVMRDSADTTLSSVPFSSFILYDEGGEVIANPSAAITRLSWWDGSGFIEESVSSSTTITLGRAYCIHNSLSSPLPRTIYLSLPTVTSSSLSSRLQRTLSLSHVNSAESSHESQRSITIDQAERANGAPPAPPTNSSPEPETSKSGGCGLGSGFALIGFLTVMFTLSKRRRLDKE